MEGLVKLLIIVFFAIQLTATAAIVAALCNLQWLSFGLMVASLIASLYTGRARYEGMVFWGLPLVATVFWVWKFL